MKDKIGVNLVIEREKVNGSDIFIASSPDINVFAEGKTIEEAKKKFIRGVRTHLENFPKEKELLVRQEQYEMPMLTKVFL